MQDPEIQALVNDASMQQALKELSENPRGSRVLEDPKISKGFQLLVAAGIGEEIRQTFPYRFFDGCFDTHALSIARTWGARLVFDFRRKLGVEGVAASRRGV